MASLLLALIYISFVSLGLPDAVLGAAWPVMHRELGVDISAMGILSMTISLFTIISSLNSHRLTLRFGTARVTAFSVGLTAVAILGFCGSSSFLSLFLWAIPYGLGAGGVDASLNNYVALHYESRHMSWLHCMWGIGASAGPYVMGYALTAGMTWNQGYGIIGLLQAGLCLMLFATRGIWKEQLQQGADSKNRRQPLTLRQVFAIPGALQVMVAFFAYCALEQTAGQWASSYFAMKEGIAGETAASLAGLFYLGITLGRAFSGFLTLRLSDWNMIRLGQSVLLLGVVALALPLGIFGGMAGMLLIGLGCAPIYPCVIHSTPAAFGEENSQAIIGVQMAFAYGGSLLMPPLYGLMAQYISPGVLPVYLLGILGVMAVNLELVNKKNKKKMES